MPIEALTEAAGLALRLLGAFHALGAVLGLRRQAMDMLLTQALAALACPDPRETRAETRRAWFLSLQLLLVGVAGLLLMARLDLALPAMAASLGIHAFYLAWLAPRFFDPFDPPEEPGRGQSWRAFWLYLGVTALVALGHRAGLLRPVAEEGWPVLAIVALLALGLVGHGVRLIRKMQQVPTPMGHDAMEVAAIRRDTAHEVAIRDVPLILSPSWNEGALFDARRRQRINGRLPHDLLPWEEEEEIDAWLRLFAEIADPDDPAQCGFLVPDGAARMEVRGVRSSNAWPPACRPATSPSNRFPGRGERRAARPR